MWPWNRINVMALTEDIRYLDGNQYGYIRFYDLGYDPTTNPPTSYARTPRVVGREKLAEMYTGVPGRVGLFGRLCVCGNDRRRNAGGGCQGCARFMLTGNPSDGSTIVGTFDTIGLDCFDPDNPSVLHCGNPSDLVVYRNHAFTTALITTFSGHLVVLRFESSTSTPTHYCLQTGHLQRLANCSGNGIYLRGFRG